MYEKSELFDLLLLSILFLLYFYQQPRQTAQNAKNVTRDKMTQMKRNNLILSLFVLYVAYGSYFGVLGTTYWLHGHKNITSTLPVLLSFYWCLICQGWSAWSGERLLQTDTTKIYIKMHKIFSALAVSARCRFLDTTIDGLNPGCISCCALEQDTLSALLQSTQRWNEY